MTPLLTSLFFAAGVAGWTWTQVGRRTGNADPKGVYTIAGFAGLAAFVFFFTLLKFVFNMG